MVDTRTTGGLVVIAAVIALCNAPLAEASGCEHRSEAHAAEHGGLRLDSLWHESHGERPTCDLGNGRGRDIPTSSSRNDENSKDSSDEGKSRYCRRHWFC